MTAAPQSTIEEERAQRAILANIRQELLAPAGSIVGYSELIHEQAQSDNLDGMLPDLDRVLEASRSLYSMVDRLLSGDAAQNLFHGEDPDFAQKKMRHDLRTPINGIKGYAEMLLEDLEDFGGEYLEPDFEKLLSETNRMLSKLDLIVDFHHSDSTDIKNSGSEKAGQSMIQDLFKSIKPVEAVALKPEETGRILVVDDLEPNRDLLSRRLVREGHRVKTAEGGVVALEMLRAEEFDLVLLDLMMPEMNGFEVLAEMKKDDELTALPVIMVSALDETDSVIRCIEAGADDYLPKPVNPILLRARIKSGLQKKAWQDSEKEQKKFIRQAFSRYISPDVVDQLVSNPESLSLGGERLDITCVFTDLAGFTAMMEGFDPTDVLPVLNSYLDGMCNIVREHKGTIDKVVGDALHVFFGAPLEMIDHPEVAVKCALELDKYARDFEAAEAAKAVEFGLTRIGVHSGLAVVGNFGGETFFDYTAHGDTVNTAARMESVNKNIGTRICVSGVTAGRCSSVDFRPVGSLMLKGKSKPVEAFEPLHETVEPALTDYREAYDLLGSSGSEAIEAFKGLTESYPDDPLVSFHSKRLRQGETGTLIQMS